MLIVCHAPTSVMAMLKQAQPIVLHDPNLHSLSESANFRPRVIVSMKTSFPVILVLAASFFSPIARCASKKEATVPETLVTKARSQQLLG